MSTLFVSSNNCAAAAQWCFDHVSIFGNYSRLDIQMPPAQTLVDPIDLGIWLNDIFEQMSDDSFVLLRGSFLLLSEASFTGCIVEFEEDTLFLPHSKKMYIRVPTSLEYSACDNMLMIGMQQFCWMLPLLSDGLFSQLEQLMSDMERFKTVRQLRRAYLNYPELAQNSCYFKIGDQYHTAVIANEDHAFSKWGHIDCSIHGSSPFQQCPFCTENDGEIDMFGLTLADLEPSDYIGSSVFTGISIEDFGQYNRNVWKDLDPQNIVLSNSGCLVNPSDKYCVFKALLQFLSFTQDDLTEYVITAKTLCNNPKGSFPSDKLPSLLANTPIQVYQLEDIMQGDSLCCPAKNFSLVQGLGHCFAYLPKHKCARDYLPISQVLSNMYALTILMDQYTKPDVITIVSKHPEPVPREHSHKGKRGVKKPKQTSAPTLKCSVAVDNKTQLSQPSNLVSGKTSKYAYICAHCSKAKNVYFKTPRQQIAAKISHYIRSTNIVYEELPIYDRHACVLWHDFIFAIQFDKIYNKNLPTVQCQRSFQMATGLAKDLFKEYYKIDDRAVVKKFTEPISLGSRLSYKIDLVQQSALNSLSGDKILSIHMPKTSMIPNPTSSLKKLKASFRRVYAQLNGIVDRELLEILVKYGIEIDSLSLKQNSKCGGHAFLRFVIDLLQANSLTRIINISCFINLLIDVGAKYGSNASLLQAATRIPGFSLSSKVDDHSYRLKFLKMLRDKFFDSKLTKISKTYISLLDDNDMCIDFVLPADLPPFFKTILQNYSDTYTYQNIRDERKACFATIDDQDATPDQVRSAKEFLKHNVCPMKPESLNYSTMFCEYARYVLNLPRMFYLPIRPSDTDYNRLYHLESKDYEAYSNISSPGQIVLLPLIKSTLQEAEAQILLYQRQFKSEKHVDFSSISDSQLLSFIETGKISMSPIKLDTYVHSMTPQKKKTFLQKCGVYSILAKKKLLFQHTKNIFNHWIAAKIPSAHIMNLGDEKSLDLLRQSQNLNQKPEKLFYKNCYDVQMISPLDALIDTLTSGLKPQNSFHQLDSVDMGLLGNVTFEDLCDSVSDLSFFRDDDLREKTLTSLPSVEDDHVVDTVVPASNDNVNLLDEQLQYESDLNQPMNIIAPHSDQFQQPLVLRHNQVCAIDYSNWNFPKEYQCFLDDYKNRPTFQYANVAEPFPYPEEKATIDGKKSQRLHYSLVYPTNFYLDFDQGQVIPPNILDRMQTLNLFRLPSRTDLKQQCQSYMDDVKCDVATGYADHIIHQIPDIISLYEKARIEQDYTFWTITNVQQLISTQPRLILQTLLRAQHFSRQADKCVLSDYFLSSKSMLYDFKIKYLEDNKIESISFRNPTRFDGSNNLLLAYFLLYRVWNEEAPQDIFRLEQQYYFDVVDTLLSAFEQNPINILSLLMSCFRYRNFDGEFSPMLASLLRDEYIFLCDHTKAFFFQNFSFKLTYSMFNFPGSFSKILSLLKVQMKETPSSLIEIDPSNVASLAIPRNKTKRSPEQQSLYNLNLSLLEHPAFLASCYNYDVLSMKGFSYADITMMLYCSNKGQRLTSFDMASFQSIYPSLVNTLKNFDEYVTSLQNPVHQLAGRSDVQLSLFMNDVHYYMAGYSPRFKCTMYITGCHFHPFPGRYVLPGGEGSYQIYADQDFNGQVAMKTQGSAIPYEHPLVFVDSPNFSIDYGWFSHFQKIQVHEVGMSSILEQPSLPKTHYLKSIQDSFFLEHLNTTVDDISKYSTLTSIQRQSLKRAYTPGDIQEILTNGFVILESDSSIVQSVKDFFYKRRSTLSKEKIDLFIKYNNYSIMKNVSHFSDVQILGGLLSSTKKLSYTESYPLTRRLGFFHRSQNKFVVPKSLPTILLAGRTQDMDILALKQFGHKATDLVEMKQFKNIVQQTRPIVQKVDKGLSVKSQGNKPLIQDYFKCKRPPALAPQNLLTIPETEVYKQLQHNYGQFLENHSSIPQSYSKKTGFQLFNGQTKIYKCGYDLISNGAVVKSFEWASKCIQNSAAAFVGRQINSQTTIDPKMLKVFDEVCINYLTNLVYKMSIDPIFINAIRTFNPYDWLDKKLFPEDKKQKYYSTLFKQSVSTQPKFISSFKTMVKSGEVQFTNFFQHQDGYLLDQDSRPRNISIPSADTCGGLTALQSCIFPAIQRVDPGFVQATTKDVQTQRYKDVFELLNPTQSISLDGSSFDSTQYAPLQRAVDSRFWQLLEPILSLHLYRDSPYKVQPAYVTNLVRDACQLTHTLFVHLPCSVRHQWTAAQSASFRRDWPRDYQDNLSHEFQYMPVIIHGTTFSGHPTATTLGNTLRSICYVHFYARMANISTNHFRYFAAGDDVNIFCTPQTTQLMYDSILKHTARSNSPVSNTLGQIVKEIRLSRWDDIDFCSKWSFSDGSYGSFKLSRDCYKTLATRLFYSGTNKIFLDDPDLYVDALYQGFKSEHLSLLVEDLLISRKKTNAQLTQQQWSSLELSKNFEHNQDMSYPFEEDINARLKISVYTLLRNIRLSRVELSGLGSLRHIKIPKYSLQFIVKNTNITPHIISAHLTSMPQKKNRSAKRAEIFERKKVEGEQIEQALENQPAPVTDKQINRDFNSYLRKSKIPPTGTNALYQGVTHLKDVYGIPKKSVSEIQSAYKNVSDPLHSKIVALMSFLQSRSSSELVRAIGMKQVEVLDSKFSTLSPQEQRQLLCEILLDDWAPAIKAISSAALPHIWRAVKNSSYGQKAIGLLRDYLGIDINDDSLILGPHFQRAASYQRQLNWADFSSKYSSESSSYDGVSTQAICSILFPEYVKSRIPSDQTVKCGLVAKQYSTTITTNASGHVGFCLRPWYLCTANWIQVLNASDFSPSTWSQASAGTWTAGPLTSLTTVTGFRLTACCVEIQPIVSSLNNSGMITTCMNDDTNALNSNFFPVTPVTVRDSQYLTYGNLMGSSGHRLVYHNDSVGDSSFLSYAASPAETDYMIVVVTGAQASSAVLQLTVTYQCEFTSVGNVLVEQATTPAGPATLKCLASALAANPNLRLLGHQESTQLYSALLTCTPKYDSVLNTLLSQPMITSCRQVFTNTGSQSADA